MMNKDKTTIIAIPLGKLGKRQFIVLCCFVIFNQIIVRVSDVGCWTEVIWSTCIAINIMAGTKTKTWKRARGRSETIQWTFHCLPFPNVQKKTVNTLMTALYFTCILFSLSLTILQFHYTVTVQSYRLSSYARQQQQWDGEVIKKPYTYCWDMEACNDCNLFSTIWIKQSRLW